MPCVEFTPSAVSNDIPVKPIPVILSVPVSVCSISTTCSITMESVITVPDTQVRGDIELVAEEESVPVDAGNLGSSIDDVPTPSTDNITASVDILMTTVPVDVTTSSACTVSRPVSCVEVTPAASNDIPVNPITISVPLSVCSISTTCSISLEPVITVPDNQVRGDIELVAEEESVPDNPQVEVSVDTKIEDKGHSRA